MDTERTHQPEFPTGRVVGQGELIFKSAKQLDHISGTIQEIRFAPQFHSSSYRLLEVDRELAESLVGGGEQLVIRGCATDLVIACSSRKSYQVKEVETSNVFLLANPSPSSAESVDEEGGVVEVAYQTGSYLEMIEMDEPGNAARQHLRDMLSRHQLRSFESEHPEGNGLGRQQVLDEIQLSEMELDAELEQLPVVTIGGGGIFLLSEEYRKQLIDAVVELCDNRTQPDIECNHLGLDSLKAAVGSGVGLNAHQEEAIRQWFLPKFCDTNADGSYSLRESAVYRERLAYFLNPIRTTKDIPLVQLEKAMELLVPIGLNHGLKHEYLRGLALLEENIVTGLMVRLLRANDLPLEVDRRFERLFAVRSAWRKEDIEPYLVDLCSTPAKVEELLLKFCKAVRKGNERFFSRKQSS